MTSPPAGLPGWWASGKEGYLCPWAQAQVWALVRVSEKRGLDLSDWEIAEEVTKVGGGHPSKQAIAKLRACFAADSAWYPGKTSETAKRPGPKPLLTESKKLAIARSAKALKSAGEEPSESAVVEKCPRAAINPDTNEPFTDKYILQVFRSYCFDPGSEIPWDHQSPLQKTALPDFLKAERLVWARKSRLCRTPSLGMLNIASGWTRATQ